jgi:hypothetical protein
MYPSTFAPPAHGGGGIQPMTIGRGIQHNNDDNNNDTADDNKDEYMHEEGNKIKTK